MHYISFLIIKNSVNDSFSEGLVRESRALTEDEIQFKKKLEDITKSAKKLEKKYEGKEGAKKLQKDAEEKIHAEIKNARDYNESVGNKNVLRVFKGYDQSVVHENINGKIVTRFKTLYELKKELEKNQKIFLEKKSRNKNENFEIKSSKDSMRDSLTVKKEVNSVDFNYQLAVEEEQALQLKEGFNFFERESVAPNAPVREEKPTGYLIAFPIILIIAGLLIWKKFFTK